MDYRGRYGKEMFFSYPIFFSSKKRVDDVVSAATVNPDAPNVLDAMVQLEQARTRAKATNKLALDAEKEKKAAEQEVQRLQQVLQAKRARTHATTANDHEECDKKSSDDMDLADHRREATRIQNRHSIPLGSRGEVPTPQEGKTKKKIEGWGTPQDGEAGNSV